MICQSTINLSLRATVAVAVLTLCAAAGAAPETADTYTWHAELVAFDGATKTATLKARVVSHNEMSDWSAFTEGERITLTWSGTFSNASGVRTIAKGTSGHDQLSMPVEFRSFDDEGKYLTFRVMIPEKHVGRISALKPGDWVTARSRHHATDPKMAVTGIRAYTDTAADIS